MKFRTNTGITFIFALFACLIFQTLPILGLNNLQAQEPRLPLPMPTYDVDPYVDPVIDPDGAIFPNLSLHGNYYDEHFFRTVLCKISLIVDIEHMNQILAGTGWLVIPYGPGIGDDETTVDVQWLYRILNQWPGYDDLTHETVSGMFLGTLAFKAGVGPAFLVFTDVRSAGIDLFNDIVGGGDIEVSREGSLRIKFMSKSKINGGATLKFKAMVKEPISGLNINVSATLPEGEEPSRHVGNPAPILVVYMDLSMDPADEGRPFRYWIQQDKYDFDHNTQPFELKVSIPNNKLKLPGGRVLPVKRVPEVNPSDCTK